MHRPLKCAYIETATFKAIFFRKQCIFFICSKRSFQITQPELKLNSIHDGTKMLIGSIKYNKVTYSGG